MKDDTRVTGFVSLRFIGLLLAAIFVGCAMQIKRANDQDAVEEMRKSSTKRR